ncbi:MAG: leucine-rich repeat domain-containing protein, partial [Clostridia bacterium]|nr:leucine-rich repeat domain-containing protein [Clostridia bacterium]
VPKTINGIPVLKIGEKAYSGIKYLKQVTVPDGVTTIGPKAFYNCYNLELVSLPDSVTAIEENAFEYCTGLMEFTFPKNLKSIGDYAFYHCCLSQISLPEGLETIGDSAFSGNYLRWVVVPDSVVSMGSLAFNCNTTLDSIHLGKNLRELGDYHVLTEQTLTTITVSEENPYLCAVDNALYSKDKSVLYRVPSGDYSLMEYTVLDGCTEIYQGAFFGTNLYTIRMPDTVTTIGEKAFASTSRLENVYLSNNLTELGKGAFQSSYITSVTFPQSFTEVPAEAFMYAPKLEEVIFEGDITSIGNSAFYVTTRLKNVYCSQSEEEWSKVTIGTQNSYFTKATIHYDCFYHSPTLKVCGASGNATADYTVSSQDAGKALICATYLGNQLISVESVPAVAGVNPFTMTDSFDTVKFFLWETLSDTNPVYKAEAVGFPMKLAG